MQLVQTIILFLAAYGLGLGLGAWLWRKADTPEEGA